MKNEIFSACYNVSSLSNLKCNKSKYIEFVCQYHLSGGKCPQPLLLLSQKGEGTFFSRLKQIIFFLPKDCILSPWRHPKAWWGVNWNTVSKNRSVLRWFSIPFLILIGNPMSLNNRPAQIAAKGEGSRWYNSII